MTIELDSALNAASLSQGERQMLERLVERLADQLGDELNAIWLYGSRARGEQPDGDSDIDLMVIADGGQERHGSRAHEILYKVAREHRASPVWYSIHVHDREWLHDRREIRSFFIQEVDRDKIVLHGSRLE